MYDDLIILGALVVLALNIVVLVAICQTASRTGKIYKLICEKEGKEQGFNFRLYAKSIGNREEGLNMLNEAFLKELSWKVKGQKLTEEEFRKVKFDTVKKYEKLYALIGEAVPAQLSLLTQDTAKWVFS